MAKYMQFLGIKIKMKPRDLFVGLERSMAFGRTCHQFENFGGPNGEYLIKSSLCF